MRTNETPTHPPPSKPKRKPRAPRTQAQVARWLGDVLVGVRIGTIDPKVANSLIYGAAALSNVLSETVLEERLASIEALIRGQQVPQPTGPLADLVAIASRAAP